MTKDGVFSEELASWGKMVGEEARKNSDFWLNSGIYEKYLSGSNVLDIGFDGYIDGVQPITPKAIGVGLNYPDYDGKTLPFPDESQDTVFASHCLEHIDDYRGALTEWFRVVKIGGHLFITVPHQFLYEKRIIIPSKFNADHRRFYTSASLLREVEEAIDPLQFRVRHLEDNDRGFDYSIPPDEHSVGCYEIILIIEKIASPPYADAINSPPTFRTASAAEFISAQRPGQDFPVMKISSRNAPQSVIIFKMDHLGDFIAAKPVLAKARQAFPGATLTLVCGHWNVDAARKLEQFDEIIEFSLFARYSPVNGTIDIVQRLEELRLLLNGRVFDLAVDLRVDADSRVVLKHVNAAVRAGFGHKNLFPYLDISLPLVSSTKERCSDLIFADARRFEGAVGKHLGHTLEIPADRYPRGLTIVWGPYCHLSKGEYLISLVLADEEGKCPPFDYDVTCRGGNLRLAYGSCGEVTGDGLLLILDEDVDDLEVRIWGKDEHSKTSYIRGCTFTKFGKMGGAHQTEMMAMLMALTEHRVRAQPFEEQIA